jgi:hypothetical protein
MKSAIADRNVPAQVFRCEQASAIVAILGRLGEESTITIADSGADLRSMVSGAGGHGE